MPIAKSRIVALANDVLSESDALTEEEAQDLAEQIADKMVSKCSDAYDDDKDEEVTEGLGRDDD